MHGKLDLVGECAVCPLLNAGLKFLCVFNSVDGWSNGLVSGREHFKFRGVGVLFRIASVQYLQQEERKSVKL